MTVKEQKKIAVKTPKAKDTRHNTVGDRIEWKMRAMGLKQNDLAKMCDVPTSSINNAIRNIVAMPRYIKKLAEVLDTSVEYLVNGEIDPTVVHVPENTSLLACDTPVKPDNDVDYYIVSIKKGERLFTPKGVEHIGKISKVYIGHNN